MATPMIQTFARVSLTPLMRLALAVASSIALALAGCDASSAAPAEPAPVSKDDGLSTARELLARTDLAAYHGWIKYLLARADAAVDGNERTRLGDWGRRILQEPASLEKLRGVHEWAYESKVDGSGQPFVINVPTDYTPNRRVPLFVHLHGYGADHLDEKMVDQNGPFELAVLGRSRGSGFRALGEADVVEAIDYVQRHWAIDPARIHLVGSSMGAHGAAALAARFPDRFASVWTFSGWLSDLPLENLLTVPVYALHGARDPIVPAIADRGPLDNLLAAGGDATYVELADGGHDLGEYGEAIAAGEAWCSRKVSPSPTSVRHIDFTALDGNAARAWWAEISEWGAVAAPARFELTAEANALVARLDNVASLRIRISESPFSLDRPLRVSVGSQTLLRAAPLPASLLVRRTQGGWELSDDSAAAAPFRLHTPGGANQLYAGSPLLIVYGTRGGAATARAMRDAALAARQSTSAAWGGASSARGRDGVPLDRELFGGLPIRADRDVTPDDIREHDLVLIGSATQNGVVETLAAQLPVSLGDGRIRYSDGVTVASAGNALGLVHYNPLATSRLLFWVASEDDRAYANGGVPRLMDATIGLDSVVMDAHDSHLVIGRSFDSRWRWISRTEGPPLPDSLAETSALNATLAGSLRRATDTDFALSGDVGFELKRRRWPSVSKSLAPGVTQLSDVAGLLYYEPVVLLTLSGTELRQAAENFAALRDIAFEPPFDPAQLDGDRAYSLVLTADQLWPFGRHADVQPRRYRRAPLTAAAAFAQFAPLMPSTRHLAEAEDRRAAPH